MTTNKEQGERLLKEAQWIFEKDLKSGLDEENYNLAVRRAQEVVELYILCGDFKHIQVFKPHFNILSSHNLAQSCPQSSK